MTTGSETWTGTNGSAWPSPWTTSGGAGLTADIQSNRGRLVTPTTAYQGVRADYGTALDLDVTFTCSIANPVIEQYVTFAYRYDSWTSSSSDQPNNGYAFALYTLTGQIEFYKSVSGVRTDIVFTGNGAFSPTAGVDFNVHVQIYGAHHRIRYWNVGSGEPTTWHVDSDDSSFVTSGTWGLATTAGTTNKTVFFDDLAWNNGVPSVPFKRQLLGTQVTNTAALTTVISFTGTIKPQIGDLVVVYGSRDNVNTDPLTGDSFSDGTANSYTRVPAGSNVTSAGSGLVGVAFYCFLTVAWSAGTNTLTWTHPSTKAAMASNHWINLSSLRASGSNTATSTAGAPSVALTTPVANDVVMAMEAIEYSTAGTSTADTDTTNGNWSALLGPVATTGTTLAAVKLIYQYKFATGTGTQTFNPTHSVTTNVDTVAIILDFVPAVTSSTANLGTATLGLTANKLSGTYVLGTAGLAVGARNLGVATGDTEAWNSTLTDWNSSTVDWNANSAASSTANLGNASLGLSAFSISGTRTLNSAALAFVANAISQTRTFSKADVGFVATSLDTISLGAEPIGQGRTLPIATLGLSAYNFTYGGQVLPGASVALAAALLASTRSLSAASLGVIANGLGTSLTLGTATLGMTAYGLTVAAVTATANLGNATVGFTANPLTFNDAIIAIAASLGISATALGITGSLNVGTATLALLASNLADSQIATAASLGLAATGLTASSRSLGTGAVGITALGIGVNGSDSAGSASVGVSATGLTGSGRNLSAATAPFNAFGMSAGYALASASIAVIANNLSLLGSFNLGTATIAFSASNLTNQTTGQATLGRADFSVTAANLSVGLSAGLSASVAMSATNLARAAVVGTSSLSVAALGMTQLRSAALGLASLVTTAYNMSQSAPGSAALGSGTLLLSANPMTRFALLSAGLATVALDAFAVGPKVNASGAVGSLSTAAQPMSSTRAVAKGILDLTAYGFGTYRPSTIGAAALTITAYALTAQAGKSRGRISTRNGYVQFKTGGRGLTGPKVANPISSFKTVGG